MGYVPKVHKTSGGAGGDKLVIESGGRIDFQSGGEFYAVDTTILAQQLKLAFLSPITVTQHASADISNGSVLSPAYGYHVLSAATGMSKASALIPAASKGAILYLDGAYLVGDANISCLTDSTVGKVVNVRGSDISSLELSAANYVQMVCMADGTWSVIGQNNYTEHVSS